MSSFLYTLGLIKMARKLVVMLNYGKPIPGRIVATFMFRFSYFSFTISKVCFRLFYQSEIIFILVANFSGDRELGSAPESEWWCTKHHRNAAGGEITK